MSVFNRNVFGSSGLRINSLFRNVDDYTNNVRLSAKQTYAVCPFNVIAGAINSTEAGYKGLNFEPNDYANFQEIFNGQNSILIEWMDSVKRTTVQGTKPEDDKVVVKLNVGKVYKGILLNAGASETFQQSTENALITSAEITNKVSLIFLRPLKDETQNDNDYLLDNFSANIFKFFEMPEITAATKQVKGQNIYVDTPRINYYIDDSNLVYDKQSKKLISLEINFISINDRLKKSGLANNQFIYTSDSNSAPTALPLMSNRLGKVIVDPAYLTPRPITHGQISFFGNAAINNITFIGRTVNIIRNAKQDISGYKINPPMLLFPYRFQSAPADNQNFNSLPTEYYYNVIGARPTLEEYFDSWKQSIQSQYNVPAGECSTYRGVIETKFNETIASNPYVKAEGATVGVQNMPFWDSAFLTARETWDNSNRQVQGSSYCYADIRQAYPNNNYPATVGQATINLSNVANRGFSNWNAYNYFITAPMIEMPVDIKQSTPVALSSIPIFGWILNKMALGLPVGYKTTKSINIPTGMPISLLVSCSSYLSSVSAYKKVDNFGLLAFESLNSVGNDVASAMYGVYGNTTAFAFSLSNRISLKPTTIATNTYAENTAVNITTDMLKQLSADKTKVYLVNDSMQVLPPNTDNAKNYEVGFIVDRLQSCAVFKGNYKVMLYSMPYNPFAPVDSDYCVFASSYKTPSSLSGNMRQWWIENQFSNQNSSNDNNLKMRYPVNVECPSPPNADELDIYYDDIKISQANAAVYQLTGDSFATYLQGGFTSNAGSAKNTTIISVPNNYKAVSFNADVQVNIACKLDNSGTYIDDPGKSTFYWRPQGKTISIPLTDKTGNYTIFNYKYTENWADSDWEGSLTMPGVELSPSSYYMCLQKDVIPGDRVFNIGLELLPNAANFIVSFSTLAKCISWFRNSLSIYPNPLQVNSGINYEVVFKKVHIKYKKKTT